MKITSSLNQWGIPSLEISGESSHENTLLKICEKRGPTHVWISESAGTDDPTTVHLKIEFGYAEFSDGVKASDVESPAKQ